jgi:DNA-binding transcriptional MocR family regulator
MNTQLDHPGLSRRLADLQPSPIREILAVIDVPGMVSFAGGLPAPETFPAPQLAGMPHDWLQYGPTQGEALLREQIAAELGATGLRCGAEQVLILSGSQQGIDLVAKLVIDAGTAVAVESPTYLAALQVFRFFGARMLRFDSGAPGAAWTAATRPALLYANPTFQNPTGRCYTAAERDRLAATCDEQQILLFEDDPYRDLAYDDCERRPVCARLQRTSWVYQGSFSKTFAPGLRLGFLAASPDLMMPLLHLKQAADLHSSRLSQWLVLEHLRSPQRAAALDATVALYRRKREVFALALQRHLGSIASWELPPGGLFFWLRLDRDRDTRAVLPEALRRGVAFMPGEPFFADGRASCGTLRLNFSHADAPAVDRGLSILADLLK